MQKEYTRVHTWARELDVHFGGGDAHVRVRADDHDCSVGGEGADKRRKCAVADVHGQRLALAAAARQLELLDDVGDLLEAVHVVVLLPAALSNHEECHALKQNHLHSITLQPRVPTKTVFDAVLSARAGCRSGPHLIRCARLCEALELPFKLVHVGDEGVHGLTPRLVPGRARQRGGAIWAARGATRRGDGRTKFRPRYWF